MRVIDGNTFETLINGSQVGVALVGIDVAQGNTACGREATKQLEALVAGGNLTLEEDSTVAFDAHKQRVYFARTKDGRAVSQELVKAGVARANGRAEGKHLFAADEAQARAAQRGCLGGGSKTGGVVDPRLTEAGFAVSDTFRAAPAPPTNALPARDAIALPDGFGQQTVAAGMNNPTGFAFAPDGRVLVNEKSGRVRVIKGGALLPTPLIDIRDRVNDRWDHGLLGIAVDPNFAANGYLYLLYTYENNAAQYDGKKTARLARYTVVGDTASPATERAILGTVVGDATHPSCNDFAVGTDCIVSDYASHSIGSIKFASDGTLYASMGDAASFNAVDDDALRSQDIDILAGKLVHVTATGQGVGTNPFWNGDPNANRSKVWAYGFRNPFRFNVRPGSDVPYVGDVGWNTWEEVNVAVPGGNFGWPCYEGEAQQAGYAPKATCQDLYAQGPDAVQYGLVTYDHYDANGRRSST
ncbi:MAG: PQQ-dependent sugar dehydrogenase, partial [Chloroflexota bacterium]|nr:PQQ-dependent sugar dehydrogenase [Chloroflexota bacterium]